MSQLGARLLILQIATAGSSKVVIKLAFTKAQVGVARNMIQPFQVIAFGSTNAFLALDASLLV